MVQVYWKRSQTAATETHFLLITKPELCMLTNYHLLSRASPIWFQLCFLQLLFCFYPWQFSTIPLKTGQKNLLNVAIVTNKRKKIII